MEANVIGQVHNTQVAKHKGLYALFEAITKSIHALEDTKTKNGKIEVKVIRLQTTFSNIANSPSPVTGFTVFDNGIGFTDENYQSFNETNSQFKFKRGGKGVGRFTWLKVFEHAQIESIFYANGTCSQRTFTFSLANKSGISNHTCDHVEELRSYSRVVLMNVREEYRKGIPTSNEIIANRIVEHFLEYFVLGKMPEIRIIDESNQETIDLWKYYDALMAANETKEFTIGGHTFHIIHFMLQTTISKDHRLYFTGHQRVGKEFPLKGKIPNLPKHFTVKNKEKCIYAGYVSSEYLDEHLNSARTDFDIPNKNDDMFIEELDWHVILENVYSACGQYLEPYTKPIEEKKNERIQKFVENNAPEYRHILKHYPKLIDEISPDADKTEIDNHLHSLSRKVEADLRQKATVFLNEKSDLDDGDYFSERKRVYDQFLVELNDLSKSKLAKYILERKLMLDVFEYALQIKDNQKYAAEREIHRIIFPLRKSSDDVLPDDHNLWIIDEKLVYHQYLASDLPFNKIEALENSSDERPDLLVFNCRSLMSSTM